MLSCPTCVDLAREFAQEVSSDALAHREGRISSQRAGALDCPAATFLESQRLWYRAPEPSDALLHTAWRCNPNTRRTRSPSFPVTPESMRQWIEKQNPFERGKVNDHATFMFGPKGADEPIGCAGLFLINWIDRSAEFGIVIDPAHWNRGYGREAARQMLQYGFDELDLHRVELQVLNVNPGGIKAYQAAGFVLEGTKRHAAFVEGRRHDVLLMSVLREEWKA